MLFDQALTDTPPEVERMQIDLLRQAGQARRTQLMLSLSQSMFALSWHNLQKVFPHLSETEQKIKFVELLYGSELAHAFQQFLQQLENDA
ncbi:MAG: hypothetical protein H6654_15900 [Ardenticatenaceae bacterium]|nr:hypothetical protein [Anaerolineales bacterium]MCB8939535.1 hypothetical protein [Ardenticatenaceae bacterium]MCB8975042.1 hypothetical protein [Ardenticatenaceae bacterium]